ncbi:Pyridine nucleotide-disulfide oxidoreductase [Frankia canadensis]|uniref:Pyridine nucleotide-disulfide oxidoreductase n=1 Tax=Frankia canadensis TaxID=1836972 RepID=A0A2I2KSJ8_9ACTN|nr:FAD-dependent oxidoreductase [Frankia canadensis]SNQ48648.1 Pyridine nucleotide-disulfide oxidoreductase [Frankia canadensis]SOU55938.1 Pyridine nucleotide-disulfide oxidoreductase [Frankia canadensis]
MSTVAVVGGGYGGITAAKALDDVADVLLVEPRDTFVHNVAALRGLVDPSWLERLFLPYDRLLARGRVVRDRAVGVDPHGVTLASGDRIAADYLLLATGSTYPFPAKVDVHDSRLARDRIRATHEALAGSANVLVLGAGPAGLELAGEISAAWPDKTVTVVDPAGDLLAGTGLPDELRAEVRAQLVALGVTLLLGDSLSEPPPSDPGTAKTFTATTTGGARVDADIWFRCYGVTPTTDYLAPELAAHRTPGGQLRVTPALHLPGYRHVFAIGDITDIAEPKMAKAAEQHAGVAATNIRVLLGGGDTFVDYEPGPPGISLPLGPAAGASYAPSVGVLGAEQTSQIKGTTMRIESYLELLNLR